MVIAQSCFKQKVFSRVVTKGDLLHPAPSKEEAEGGVQLRKRRSAFQIDSKEEEGQAVGKEGQYGF